MAGSASSTATERPEKRLGFYFLMELLSFNPRKTYGKKMETEISVVSVFFKPYVLQKPSGYIFIRGKYHSCITEWK